MATTTVAMIMYIASYTVHYIVQLIDDFKGGQKAQVSVEK